jgi:putative hemolysin
MYELLAIGACLILNAFFSAYEMAFVSISRSELRGLARAGNATASRLLQLRANPERTLSIIQIGITLVGALAAAVGGSSAGDNLEPYFIRNYGVSEKLAEVLSVTLVVIPITYLSVVVGELVPKTLALRNPSKIVFSGASTLFVADRVFSPFITVFEWSTRAILKIFFRKSKAAPSVEHASIEIDSLSPAHQKYMMNLAQIEKRQIKEILLPWARVMAVASSMSIEEVFQIVLSSGHTRLPVVEGETVVGVLHTKEFIVLRESGDRAWPSIIRPVLKIKSTDSALGAMRLLQDRRNHMAVVFGAGGERLGLVTIEDIIEEIVGDIFDEDDDGRVRNVYASRLKSRGIIAED